MWKPQTADEDNMKRRSRQKGFSLTEALLAAAILAVGLAMIAMVFPVGVKLASQSAERTIGTVAADEAFAKIQLYKLNSFSDPDWPADTNSSVDCFRVSAVQVPDEEKFYPSAPTVEEKRYCWSALCRRTEPNTVQITVFVCRTTGQGGRYYDMGHTEEPQQANNDNPWPVPVKLNVDFNSSIPRQLALGLNPDFDPASTVQRFVSEGCRIVDDATGNIYYVMERKNSLITLSDNWQGAAAGRIWVVPPGVGSSRYPCVGVFQREISFPGLIDD